jgi:hypothetical protein
MVFLLKTKGKVMEFLSQELLESELSASAMNKIFSVNGILVSSFIARQKKLGAEIPKRKAPVKFGSHGYVYLYSVKKVIKSAVDSNFLIEKPIATEKDKIEHSTEKIKELNKIISQKNMEIEKLISHHEKISNLIGFFDEFGLGSSLFSEKYIVDESKKYKQPCGVYFLVKENKIVYVGQSVNVYSRVGHHSGVKDFDRVAWIECEKEKLDLLESIYIHLFEPELNGNSGTSNLKSAPISNFEIKKMIGL